MNLFSINSTGFRLSPIYERGLIYMPVYETGHRIDGKKELEPAFGFTQKDHAIAWIKANQDDFTKLRIAAFKPL